MLHAGLGARQNDIPASRAHANDQLVAPPDQRRVAAIDEGRWNLKLKLTVDLGNVKGPLAHQDSGGVMVAVHQLSHHPQPFKPDDFFRKLRNLEDWQGIEHGVDFAHVALLHAAPARGKVARGRRGNEAVHH